MLLHIINLFNIEMFIQNKIKEEKIALIRMEMKIN